MSNLLEERQNQNKAMLPYHINHLQQKLDKNTTLVSVTLLMSHSVHMNGMNSTEDLLTSLYLNKPTKSPTKHTQNHKIKNITVKTSKSDTNAQSQTSGGSKDFTPH